MARRQQRQAQARENRSILDSVLDDLRRLQQSLGPADRVKVGEYVDAVREVERRIQRVETRGATRSCRRSIGRRAFPSASTSTSS